MERRERSAGLMLGTAVGDALGYPAEGLSRRRIARLYGGSWRHRFLLGRGLVSDDTDHTVFVAQALLAHPDDAERFARRLARSLRWWFLALPIGLGGATARSILRLWIGFSPARSGVFSAGNGAAMRAAILGAAFADDRERREAYLRAQTRITHSDPKALAGAAAVAALAAWTVREDLSERPDAEALHEILLTVPGADAEWRALAGKIRGAAAHDLTVEAFAESLGLARGVSGYVYHTVPVAAYAWHRHFGDFEATLAEVMNCGGDTDTVGAIAGALAGTAVGEGGIPAPWLDGLVDWPRSRHVLRLIGERVCEAGAPGARPVAYFWPGLVLRNAVCFVMTFAHLFRRMAPPY